MDYSKTGFLIASLRKEKGLTQKELADKLGITDRAVSKWERGLGCPDISLLDDLSRILNISILEILKGRRLNKDEIVNNESIIESMNYSKENLKYRFKRYFNTTSIFIITVIALMLVFSNFKSMYYLNKKYHHTFSYYPSTHEFTEIENNIEKIKKDRGIYSEEDYKEILSFVNKLEVGLKKENRLYYFEKANYTFPEIIEFYVKYSEHLLIYASSTTNKGVYRIVHNYDSSVIDNILICSSYTDLIMGNYMELSKQIQVPYYNNRNISKEIINYIKDFIYYGVKMDNILLKDIIEVGEINE